VAVSNIAVTPRIIQYFIVVTARRRRWLISINVGRGDDDSNIVLILLMTAAISYIVPRASMTLRGWPYRRRRAAAWPARSVSWRPGRGGAGISYVICSNSLQQSNGLGGWPGVAA